MRLYYTYYYSLLRMCLRHRTVSVPCAAPVVPPAARSVSHAAMRVSTRRLCAWSPHAVWPTATMPVAAVWRAPGATMPVGRPLSRVSHARTRYSARYEPGSRLAATCGHGPVHNYSQLPRIIGVAHWLYV